MSDSIMGMLGQVLDQNTIKSIGQQLGSDEQTTQKAVSAALPTLLGALSRNASTPDGAQALHGAIERDHDGGLLDNLSGFLGGAGGDQSTTSRMVGHIFGGKQSRVEQGISQASGLDSAASGKLMGILGPMVMGAIGKKRKSSNLDAGGLAGLLGKERESLERDAPKESSLIGRMLDSDGDGDFDMSDMMKMGAGYLGKMFGR